MTGRAGWRRPKAWWEGLAFLIFFPNDKTAAPEVVNSCSFVPLTLFGTSLVMSSYYAYEI